MKMSSALSIRHKCTSDIRITTCSTEFQCPECDDSNKRIEVQTHKRYFHPKKYVSVRIKVHEVEQMRNLCMFFYLLACVLGVFRFVSWSNEHKEVKTSIIISSEKFGEE